MQKVDLEKITSRAQCDDVLFRLDGVIGEIEDQLRLSKLDFARQFPGEDELQWRVNAQRALKTYKRIRQAVQTKKGSLPKPHVVSAKEMRRERMFIDEAKRMLPRSTWLSIWDRVNLAADETGD